MRVQGLRVLDESVGLLWLRSLPEMQFQERTRLGATKKEQINP